MGTTKQLLGLRIKELRKVRGLTQSQLAELIDVDSKHLSRIETGSSSPSLDTLENIADKLQVEIKDLFVFTHLKNTGSLITEMVQKLNGIDESKVRLAYRIINDITL